MPYITYYTTQAGILGFTQGMALQYASKHIRANGMLPGLMNTPMMVDPLKGVYGAGDVEKMMAMRNQQCPTGKMGDALGALMKRGRTACGAPPLNCSH